MKASLWLVLLGRRVIKTNHHAQAHLGHPSREARRQEAQVFHPLEGGLGLPRLHKQASRLPASSASRLPQGVVASRAGCSPQRGRRLQALEKGRALLMGTDLQNPPSPRRGLGPPRGRCILRTLRLRAAICFLSRLSRCMGSRGTENSLCRPIGTRSIASSFSLFFELMYKTDIETIDPFHGTATPRKI